jgi:AraC-like DNA-binding protein
MKPREDSARGVLDERRGAQRFRNVRFWPAEDLTALVEHYWIVSWDLRGQPSYEQETLPHPAVHLVFEPEGVRLYGVFTRRFARRLSGAGRVVGVRFRPGGFRPFLGAPVRSLTDRSVPAVETLGRALGPELERAAGTLDRLDEGEAAAVVEGLLRRRRPPPDARVALVNRIVERITADGAVRAVGDVARPFGLSPRTLQRLFREYVGVGPKWVIRRCRLHDAVERLAAGQPADWPRLARELGYFDQAHLIHDFKRMVGRTPAEYARDQR